MRGYKFAAVLAATSMLGMGSVAAAAATHVVEQRAILGDGQETCSPVRKRVRGGPGWTAPRYRRSKGAQAHRARRGNRLHVSRRTRRKHRRAA